MNFCFQSFLNKFFVFIAFIRKELVNTVVYKTYALTDYEIHNDLDK